MEALIAGDMTEALSKEIKGVVTVSVGSLHPVLQHVYNLSSIASGGGGYDMFRQKEILSKDVKLGGSLWDKTKEYGAYTAAQNAPSVFAVDPYRRFSTDERRGLDKSLNETPFLGPVSKTILNISNYGQYEKEKGVKGDLEELKAAIILDSAEEAQQMLALSRKNLATMNSKEKKKKASPEERRAMQLTSRWHYRVFRPLTQQMLKDQESGDVKNYDKNKATLNKQSRQFLSQIIGKDEETEESDE